MEKVTNYLAYSVHRNKGIYALILGSGISRNSGIPTGWDITLDLLSQTANLEEEKPDDLVAWYTAKFKEEPDYSNVLEKLSKTPSERLNLLKSYFESDGDDKIVAPSSAHRAIAKLIKKGYFKVVITTNFDRLLEQALREEGIEPQVVKHVTDINGAIPIVHSEITIVKINGDYLDSRFLNTKTELEEYESDLNNYVQTIINDFGIISCGWSAKWDNALINIIRTNSNHRYSSYWACVGDANNELSEISKSRKGEILKISNADDFFSELYEKIEALEGMESNDPLSADIALARLKKYLSKEEYLIQFDDLLRNEAVKIVELIDKNYSVAMQPSIENLSRSFHLYSNGVRQFIPLIITSCKWLKTYHEPTICNILLMLNKPHFQSGIQYDENRSLKYFPSMLLMYSIGITALETANYSFLNKIFSMRVGHRILEDNKVSILEYNHSILLDREVSNALLGKSYKTPISTYVREYLQPFFTHLFADENSYRDKFDFFEYLLALNYTFYVEDDHYRGWAPWGEFVWRQFERIAMRKENSINDFEQIAAKELNEMIVFKEGMFGKSHDKYAEIKQKYQEFLKEIRFR